MKKILITIAGFFVTLLTMAQSPNLLNYQGVARNAAGNVLPSQPVGLKLSILTSVGGPAVYTETRNVTTNAFGLFNVQVGSPGAITTTGTIAGINWTAFGAGSGAKFLQVEIDPVGGTNYFNVGTTQLVSVPYALNAGAAGPVGPAGGDLLGSTYPNPIIAPLAVTTGKIADGAVTTIKIADGAVTSQKITVPFVKVQADAGALIDMTNSGAGPSVSGINTGTGFGGLFSVNNPASVADGIRATTNGTGASWGIRAISSGTNGAGLFQQTNATNTANNLQSTQAGLGRSGFFTSANAANTANALEVNVAGSGAGLASITTGTGSAGLFSNTNAANNASTVSISTTGTSATALSLSGPGIWGSAMGITNTTSGMEWRTSVNNTTYTVTKIPGSTFSPLQLFSTGGMDFSNSAGTSIARLLDNGNVGIGTIAPTQKLHIAGTVRIQDGTEALNRVLRSDATGNASWVDPSGAGIVSGTGASNRIAFWNSASSISSNPNFWWDDVNSRLGIGTTTPAYPLDVVHSGATGAHIASTASFSVVDIDAFSGDAALRFQRAGVGQWNTRNEPVNNDYQWFELGGGGERMRIQRGSGNIGINQPVPAYKLDVNHGGATGIRSQSSASFSVVDIDAFSGDAALRFIKAGVNKWNTRNEPVNDDYQWFELGGGGERMRIQRGSGNVGINQPVPAYRLDVNHGGATGIRSQSSASFSVVDIDAFSGDAALRFIRAGVNKWNTRNEPVNDDYQWFELGGGGERMRIQRGSGNVGINQPLPAYRLDVNHGGATGVRVQSSASFSVVDIDGASGDAALRFIKAGVNKWNTRNEPVFDDYQIFELGGGGERFRIKRGTGFVGINTSAPATQLEVVGTITGTVKAFTIDHPLDPANKTLRHISIESPEALDVYSGNIVTDASGKAIVDLPAYFEALNKDFRYQLTVIGAFAQAIISKEIVNNKFEIATNQPNVKVSWQVQGVRHDAYMKNTFDLKMEEDKPASMKGKYYHPESYGLPQSMGVNYNADPKGSSNENVQITPAKPGHTEVIKGSSLENIKVAPSTNKPVDNSGSVAPDTKKQEVKPVAKPTGPTSTNG